MGGHKRDKRDDFLSLVPGDARRVLDMGCGDGGLGLKLKERGIEVVGVDKDEEVCEIANRRLDRVFVGDIADLELPYPPGYFDCIVYGDVLDCLIDPLRALKKHRLYLRDNGYVIASVANIRYYKVITGLIFGGTWDYVDEGILWKHHLRFYTLINIKELFTDAGFEVCRVARNIQASRCLRILNLLFLHTMKDFLTYQYYIQVKKCDSKAFSTSIKRKVYKF